MSTVDKENTNPSPVCAKNTHMRHDPDLFKHQIESYEKQVTSEDIIVRLNAWQSYLNYLRQFTQEELKDNKIHIQSLYGRCLEKCKAILKVRPNDEQYAKIFVYYTITYDQRPLKMFEWGYKHQVGELQSFFYIEWSNLLIKNEDFERAIQILNDGIKKKAAPLEKLKAALETTIRANEAFEKSKNEESQVNKEAEESKNTLEKKEEAPPKLKIFGFNYDLIKPDPVTGEEFSFEEIRARTIYAEHERIMKVKKEEEEKYLKQINDLKSKLAELESKQLEDRGPEIREKISRLNKTRDSIMLPRNYKHSLLADYTVNDEDERHSADNLTNVTNFSTWVTNDTRAQIEGDDDMAIEDDIHESNNITKHKMPDDSEDLTTLSRFPEKSSIMGERSMDTLQPPSKRCNFTLSDETGNATLYTGAPGQSMMVSSYPTPSVAGKTMSDTRNLIDNIFNQTDTIYNKTDIVSSNTTPPEKSSIFIYQDRNYEETMKFPKMANHNRSEFSIFADQQTSMINHEKPKGTKKYNEDGSLFVYPNSADNSLDGNSRRKPLQVLSEHSLTSAGPVLSNSTLANENSEIDFDPPVMASTCNFKQLRSQMKSDKPDLQFDPSSSSTCNLKNLKAGKTEHERLLETILDTTDADIDENSSDMEKEKLFNKFLGTIDSDVNQCKESPAENVSKTMSKILAEDLTSNANIKGGSNTFVGKSKKDNLTAKPNVTASGSNKTSANNITWDDYDFVEVSEADKTDGIDSKVFTFSPVKERSVLSLPESPEKEDNQLLTQEKLDKTFNNDCYKLFFNGDISMQMTQNFTQFKFQKIVEDQITELNNAEQNQSILALKEPSKLEATACLEMSQATLSVDKLKADNLLADIQENNTTIGNDPATVTSTMGMTTNTTTNTKNLKSHLDSSTFDSDLNFSTLNSSTCTTTNNMNNTIFSAIRDPFDIGIKNRLLNKTDCLIKKKNYKNLVTQHPLVKEKHTVLLKDGETYTILEMIGKGAFAKIYLIQNKLKEKSNKKFALKVDVQATAWEFYITESIHERLSQMVIDKTLHIDVSKSYIKMDQFMKYKNGCFSAMNFYNNGSLLDLINYHVEREETFPYWFVLYLTLEMLNILDYLHKCKIIHADIKADNFLIDRLPNSIEYFEPSKTKCLVLIDFNRSIDLTMLPEEAEFEAKAANKSLLCPEMKSNKAWTYQVDFYGILSCIHCIIFKKYFNVVNEKNRNRLNATFPRNYDKIFARMFDCFLNIPDCQHIPEIADEWIPKFVMLFKMELGASFAKFNKYLKDLNREPLRLNKNKKK